MFLERTKDLLVKNQTKFFIYTPPLEKTISLIISSFDYTYPAQEITEEIKAQGIFSVLSVKFVASHI